MQGAGGSASRSNAGSGAPSGGAKAKPPTMDTSKNDDQPKPDTDAAMPPSTPDASSVPASDAGARSTTMTTTGVDASAPSSQPMDAAAQADPAKPSEPVEPTDKAPPPDASTADAASGASDLLVWFALTGTNQQRRALYPLIADLEGTRKIDSQGMLSVLRNFDQLQCRRNAAVCYQVCTWATSHCDVCEGWECRRLMFQSCGSDCSTGQQPARP